MYAILILNFWGDFVAGCLENEGSLFVLYKFIFLASILFTFLFDKRCLCWNEFMMPRTIHTCALSALLPLKQRRPQNSQRFSAMCPRSYPCGCTEFCHLVWTSILTVSGCSHEVLFILYHMSEI